MLRIVAMLTIVVSHYSCHGYRLWEISWGFKKFVLQSASLGNVGVALFILMAGYFGIKSTFKWSKVVQLLLQVFTYSIGILLICKYLGIAKVEMMDSIKYFFPTLTKQYWFFTAYIVLYILSPYFNQAIELMSKKTLACFIATMFVLWSVVRTLTGCDMYNSEFPWFAMYYFMGAYLRLYPDSLWCQKKMAVGLVAGCSAILFLAIVVLDFMGRIHHIFSENATFFHGRTSFLILGLSVGLLVLFSHMNFHSVWINKIASSMFGVFLIHTHPCLKYFIWNDLLHCSKDYSSAILLLHMSGCVLLVIVACTLIEMIRKKVIEPIYMNPINRFFSQFSQTSY